MRRKEKEIQDIIEIESVIARAQVCRLALSENNAPYVVPMNFGYKDRCFYFHSAREGKKIDIIKANNRVCVELDIDHELIRSEQACKWGMKFRSVIGFGKAFIVDDLEEKKKGLDVLMAHYSHDGEDDYAEAGLDNALVIKVEIEQLTGKKAE